MLQFPDLILLSSLLAIVLIYILIKLVNSSSSYKEKKKQLLDVFQQQRLKSNRVQDKLSVYILANDAHKIQIFDGATCQDYLRQLQKNHIQNLSDKMYLKLKNSNNRIFLKKMADELKDQEVKLNTAKSRIAKLQHTKA